MGSKTNLLANFVANICFYLSILVYFEITNNSYINLTKNTGSLLARLRVSARSFFLFLETTNEVLFRSSKLFILSFGHVCTIYQTRRYHNVFHSCRVFYFGGQQNYSYLRQKIDLVLKKASRFVPMVCSCF